MILIEQKEVRKDVKILMFLLYKMLINGHTIKPFYAIIEN